jgi:hypothetical protein
MYQAKFSSDFMDRVTTLDPLKGGEGKISHVGKHDQNRIKHLFHFQMIFIGYLCLFLSVFFKM